MTTKILLALTLALTACSSKPAPHNTTRYPWDVEGACFDKKKGDCFQNAKRKHAEGFSEGKTCLVDPDATWTPDAACPLDNLALECQYDIPEFKGQDRIFVYKGGTHADPVAWCKEMGMIPVPTTQP